MNVKEKWAGLVEGLGILNDPENVSLETVMSLHIYPSKMGNGEKYLKLRKLKKTVQWFKTKTIEGVEAKEYSDQRYSILNRIALLDEIQKILDKDFTNDLKESFRV